MHPCNDCLGGVCTMNCSGVPLDKKGIMMSMSTDATRLFVQFSDCGQHIRKWQLEPFERAFEFTHARLLENEKCRTALYKRDADEAERVVSNWIAMWLKRQCVEPMLPEFAEFLTAYADAIERREWRDG